MRFGVDGRIFWGLVKAGEVVLAVAVAGLWIIGFMVSVSVRRTLVWRLISGGVLAGTVLLIDRWVAGEFGGDLVAGRVLLAG